MSIAKFIKATEADGKAIHTVRCLGADLCQQFKGGHPGTVMGAAAIGVALWKYIMRYNPANPDWLARERFVLTAGHTCLLQYLMLHFSGYDEWPLDEVKKYHSPNYGNAAGHPKTEFSGIEVTTGPLGQDIANAVGLAMAGKNLAATYNRDGYPLIDGTVWYFTGDGCLQEGVGQEAISMAGHWGLNNLVLIYDNNSVTVDGSIANCFTDDTSAKLKAQGWHVIDVEDGSDDIAAVVNALETARSVRGKPTLVNIRTVIGIGAANQGEGKVHGQPLGDADVANVKTQLGFDSEAKFAVAPSVYEYWSDTKTRSATLEREWNHLYARYQTAYPTESAELRSRLSGNLKGGRPSSRPSLRSPPPRSRRVSQAASWSRL